MKSALPKVLHRAAGLPAHRPRPSRPPRSLTPRRSSSSSATRPTAEGSAVGKRPGLSLCSAGAAARHRPCAAAGGADAPGRARARWCCCRATCRCCGATTLRRARSARTRRSGAAATVLTAVVDTPDGYGRIVRENGRIAAIVEHKDASPEEREIGRSTAASTRSTSPRCSARCATIGSSNAQGEYYLPDLVRIYRARGLTVETRHARGPAGDSGREQPEGAGRSGRRSCRRRKNDELMAAGVTIVDPATTYIGPDVTVGADTIIHPGRVPRRADTASARGCEIHSGVRDRELDRWTTAWSSTTSA